MKGNRCFLKEPKMDLSKIYNKDLTKKTQKQALEKLEKKYREFKFFYYFKK